MEDEEEEDSENLLATIDAIKFGAAEIADDDNASSDIRDLAALIESLAASVRQLF